MEKRILVLIADQYIEQDLDSLLILNEPEDTEIILESQVPANGNYSEIYIETPLVDDQDLSAFDVPVYAFATDEEDANEYNTDPIYPFAGCVEDADELFELIISDNKPGSQKKQAKRNTNKTNQKTKAKNSKNQVTSRPIEDYDDDSEYEELSDEEYVAIRAQYQERRENAKKGKKKNNPPQNEDAPLSARRSARRRNPIEQQPEEPEYEEEKPEAQPQYQRNRRRRNPVPEPQEEENCENNERQSSENPPPKRKSRRTEIEEDDFGTEETLSQRPVGSKRRKTYSEPEEDEQEVIRPSKPSFGKSRRKQARDLEDDFEEEEYDSYQRSTPVSKSGRKRRRSYEEEDYEDELYNEENYEDEDYEDEFDPEPEHPRRKPSRLRNKPTGKARRNRDYEEDDYEEDYESDDYEEEYEDEYEDESPRSRKRQKTSLKPTSGKNSIMAQKKREKEQLQAEIEEDIGIRKKPAKTVAVYSAKGGVGKTTIACETATVLSRMSHGRRNFEVCIVDYNIDFGDVQMTLDYSPEKICLTQFAERVREDLPAYRNPDELVYDKNQIRSFLQKNEETGLYALIAPITNEDSMNISSTELEVILRNLIDNGDFDFIICDTGNNTRDSTVIALDMADVVLLISTQNATTVNCNDSMLNSLSSIHFDISKMQLVINKVEKEKDVGLSADDVWEYTRNPYTDKPIPLLSKINNNTAVKMASNYHDPLAIRDSGHPFTVQIRKIAAFIAEQEDVLEDLEEAQGKKKKGKNKKKKEKNTQKKKKGLFSFFRRD